jgi:hypothetical protein
VDLHVVTLEELHESCEVALIATQPIPAPDDEISHLVCFDMLEQLLNSRSVEVLTRPALVSEDVDRT